MLKNPSTHRLLHIGAFAVSLLFRFLAWVIWIPVAYFAFRFVWTHPWFVLFVVVGVAVAWVHLWWNRLRTVQIDQATKKLVHGLSQTD
jgi:hypothetical protein